MPGYVFKDGGPIPDSELKDHEQDGVRPSTSNSSTFNTPTSSTSLSNAPTDSHALANAEHEVQGAAQQKHPAGEVKDLGWFEHPNDVAPLVGGLPNDELWLLVRRFNKQMYHVKATTEKPLGGLDLNIVDEEEFSPDKLRSNVERLYMTVVIGLMGLGKHIARLRSWREPRRTGAFCAVSTREPNDSMDLKLMAMTGVRSGVDFGPFDSHIFHDSGCSHCIPPRAFDPFPSGASCAGQFRDRGGTNSQSWRAR